VCFLYFAPQPRNKEQGFYFIAAEREQAAMEKNGQKRAFSRFAERETQRNVQNGARPYCTCPDSGNLILVSLVVPKSKQCTSLLRVNCSFEALQLLWVGNSD